MFALFILSSHLVGDYLLQNDWMSLNKKENSFACFVHVFLYCSGFYVLFFMGKITILSLILIWIQHFLQDRTSFILWYMNLVGQKNFATGKCSPWSIIVVDNVFHIFWITIVLSFDPLVIF